MFGFAANILKVVSSNQINHFACSISKLSLGPISPTLAKVIVPIINNVQSNDRILHKIVLGISNQDARQKFFEEDVPLTFDRANKTDRGQGMPAGHRPNRDFGKLAQYSPAVNMVKMKPGKVVKKQVRRHL